MPKRISRFGQECEAKLPGKFERAGVGLSFIVREAEAVAVIEESSVVFWVGDTDAVACDVVLNSRGQLSRRQEPLSRGGEVAALELGGAESRIVAGDVETVGQALSVIIVLVGSASALGAACVENRLLLNEVSDVDVGVGGIVVAEVRGQIIGMTPASERPGRACAEGLTN